jgi:hypothetical protein
MIISTISLAWMFKAQLISMIWGMKTIYMGMTPLANFQTKWAHHVLIS